MRNHIDLLLDDLWFNDLKGGTDTLINAYETAYGGIDFNYFTEFGTHIGKVNMCKVLEYIVYSHTKKMLESKSIRVRAYEAGFVWLNGVKKIYLNDREYKSNIKLVCNNGIVYVHEGRYYMNGNPVPIRVNDSEINMDFYDKINSMGRFYTDWEQDEWEFVNGNLDGNDIERIFNDSYTHYRSSDVNVVLRGDYICIDSVIYAMSCSVSEIYGCAFYKPMNAIHSACRDSNNELCDVLILLDIGIMLLVYKEGMRTSGYIKISLSEVTTTADKRKFLMGV